MADTSVPITPILTPKEISSYYKWSIWARPVLTYALTAVMCIVCLTVCVLLATGKTTLSDASALMITIVGAIAPILTSVVLGRSWERTRGANDETEAWKQRPDYDPTSQLPSGPQAPANNNDPLAVLNSLNLDAYMPKVADDEPVVQK